MLTQLSLYLCSDRRAAGVTRGAAGGGCHRFRLRAPPSGRWGCGGYDAELPVSPVWWLAVCLLVCSHVYYPLFCASDCTGCHHHGEPDWDVQTVQRHSHAVEDEQDWTGQYIKSNSTSNMSQCSKGPQHTQRERQRRTSVLLILILFFRGNPLSSNVSSNYASWKERGVNAGWLAVVSIISAVWLAAGSIHTEKKNLKFNIVINVNSSPVWIGLV